MPCKKLLPTLLEGEGEVAQSCPTLCDLWTVAHQAPLFMGFSRQEYWSGLPFPSPKGESLRWLGIEPRSPTLQADALTSAPPYQQFTTVKNCQMIFPLTFSPSASSMYFSVSLLPLTFHVPLRFQVNLNLKLEV